MDRALAECSAHQPVVDFIGGEPSLYARMMDAVKLASKRNVLAVLTTNGLKLEEQAEALVRAGLPMLQVSLDGWDSASQAMRGRVNGSFDKIRNGLRAVVECRGKRAFPIVRVLTAITRVNHGSLERILEVVAGSGVRSWGVSNYFYSNRHAYQRNQEFALTHGLAGPVAAHPIAGDVYLSTEQ